MNVENSIMATKQGFEDSFSSREYYDKQTQDGNHLNNILDFLPFKANMKLLDLGTGSGYLSFPIAKKYPNSFIVGLDIVEKALEVNRFKAKEENIQNISFITYDGVDFPFADNEFD
ncbi:class I SAM-dependent methyltransferase, partial [[Clostridium] innocuum]|nr:class I SAM-dependent methyltransferase [[Clostridium] innocuum]